MVFARGWGKEKSSCLMDLEFQRCKMKRVLEMHSWVGNDENLTSNCPAARVGRGGTEPLGMETRLDLVTRAPFWLY